MKFKKIKKLSLSLLLAFSIAGSSIAQSVPPSDIPGYLEINSIEGGTSSVTGKTLKITADATSNTVLTEWGLFNLAEGYTLDFIGDATFLNRVIEKNAFFSGNINALGANANVIFSCLNGAIINPTANINVTNSFMISTLDLKEQNIADLKHALEVNQKLELFVNKPNGKRFGILIKDGAKVTLANRIDFVSNAIINENPVDYSNARYTTTDGIIFNLDTANGGVGSIASVIPVAPEKIIAIDSNLYYSGTIKKPDPKPIPQVDASSPDPMLPLTRLQHKKVLAPTDLNNDLTGMPHNLAGIQTQVAPLEGTRVVNNIDPNQFSQNSVGAIAMNDSSDHMIAVSDFTPIGAASQVGNTGVQDEENYDFIIPAPILE